MYLNMEEIIMEFDYDEDTDEEDSDEEFSDEGDSDEDYD